MLGFTKEMVALTIINGDSEYSPWLKPEEHHLLPVAWDVFWGTHKNLWLYSYSQCLFVSYGT